MDLRWDVATRVVPPGSLRDLSVSLDNAADVARVVITHTHVDHYGLAGRLVAESDATVWVSELGAPWLSAADEIRLCTEAATVLPKILTAITAYIIQP